LYFKRLKERLGEVWVRLLLVWSTPSMRRPVGVKTVLVFLSVES
jgi:hypothetical protein